MKKVLLTLTAVAGLTVASQAQVTGFEKGNVLVEGNLGFNTSDNKNSEVKTSSFNFSPKVGYFFTDKLAAGINLNVGTSMNDQYGIDRKSKVNGFGVGVFGRYYFLELGSRFKTYAELNVDYNNTKSELTIANTTTENPKTNKFGVNAGIGANYFLTDKIALNFAFANIVGYNTSKVDADGAKSVNQFGVNVNEFNNFFNTAQFGLTFKF
ncbi:outer membrane beta-barrel protein [Sphingobacterium rhinopitheci]|uniref:outer membrane beta-barrel protein n=1 Tax=Sphingobacterium rhinopitheci TaxID=2781960 RepID=UPI001F527D77|nr:outer membrane beta-barrel protein [Sphingobacterium rhinopitheci]MCI0921215.1 porin family protein [Sphingobacterium rhinopitheci]